MATSISTRINTLLLVLIVFMAGAIIAILASRSSAGPLDPPGPPSATGTLPQVEPRSPIPPVGWDGTFPIAIDQSGSYYLTRDITGVAAQDGITVNTHDVTLDLNGFTLNGVPGSGTAIRSYGWSTVIMNGNVSNWGGLGAIAQAPNARFERLQARSDQGGGLYVNAGGTVDRCIATNNGGHGILIFGGGVIRGSYVASNSLMGIAVGGPALVERNDAHGNGASGINVGSDGATVRENTVGNNTGGGILVTGGLNRIEGNTVAGNAYAPIPFGIRVTGANNVVVLNTATSNTDNFDIGPLNTAGPEETGAATSPWSNVNY